MRYRFLVFRYLHFKLLRDLVRLLHENKFAGQDYHLRITKDGEMLDTSDPLKSCVSSQVDVAWSALE